MARMGLFAPAAGDEVVPILASRRCDYKVPLTYPGEIVVAARTVNVGRTSFTQEYAVWSTAKSALAAIGEGIIVCVEAKSGKPVPVPEEMRAAIERVEARV